MREAIDMENTLRRQTGRKKREMSFVASKRRSKCPAGHRMGFIASGAVLGFEALLAAAKIV
jgi:hypothetical protein